MARTCWGAPGVAALADDDGVAGQEASLPEGFVGLWVAGVAGVVVAGAAAALGAAGAPGGGGGGGAEVAAWASWGRNSPSNRTATLTADRRVHLRTTMFTTPAHSRTDSTGFLVQKNSRSHECQGMPGNGFPGVCVRRRGLMWRE